MPALIVSGLAGAVMIYAVFGPPGIKADRAGEPDHLWYRQRLFGPYVLPFEVASIVLLAALVGAMVISRPVDRRSRKE